MYNYSMPFQTHQDGRKLTPNDPIGETYFGQLMMIL